LLKELSRLGPDIYLNTEDKSIEVKQEQTDLRRKSQINVDNPISRAQFKVELMK